MICIEPLSGLPTACALAPDTGRAQLEKRHAFDDDYLHSVEGAETRMVVHYLKVRDSTRRLRALVEVKGERCSFIDWTINSSHADMQLVVTGAPDKFAAHNVGSPRWPVDPKVALYRNAVEFRFAL